LVAFLVWNFLLRPQVQVPQVDLKAAACLRIADVEQSMNNNLPAISTDTKVADVKAWLAKVKPGYDALVTAANAASISVDGVTKAYTNLDSAINGVTGDTLGAGADVVNTAITSFKQVESGFQGTVGCK